VAHSHKDFITAVLGAFPELRDALDGCRGLPDLEVGEFAAFTQAAKGRGDFAMYGQCLKLVDSFFAESDAALAAALRHTYLEHLEFEGSRGPAAWQLVPPRLQSAWQQVAAENRRLMALPQKGTQHPRPKSKRHPKPPRRDRRR